MLNYKKGTNLWPNHTSLQVNFHNRWDMMTPSRLVVVSFVLLSLILMSWSKPISDDQIKRFFKILSREKKYGSTEESTKEEYNEFFGSDGASSGNSFGKKIKDSMDELTIDELIAAASKNAPIEPPDKDTVIMGKNH